MLREANVTVLLATRIDALRTRSAAAAAGSQAPAPRLATVSTPDGRVFESSVFVDATYVTAV
eukprot:COSAG01_NODE_9341_length_2478_cov_1.635982_2_plen_62_part_00